MALAINLPKHIQDYIDRQIAEGHYDSEESVIVGVLEHVIDASHMTNDPELAASLAEADRGEAFELTPERKADIRRQAEANRRSGHRVRDDIRY